MNTFVIADTHFDHSDIMLHCQRPWCVDNPTYNPDMPFDFRSNNPLIVTPESLEAHNQALKENWNGMIGKKDRVIIVGDFAFANHLRWVTSLNGKKIIILGNHDTLPKDALKHFEEVHSFGCVKNIGTGLRNSDCKLIKEKITFSHYAMRSWDGSWDGSASLHGHSHGRMPELDSLLSFDIGVDIWGYIPVPWEAVQKKIDIKRSIIQSRLDGYERQDGLPKGTYSPNPAQRVIDTRIRNLEILRSIGITIDSNSIAQPPKHEITSMNTKKMITAVVAIADVVNRNDTIYTKEALRNLADGETFLWDETLGRLSVRLPSDVIKDYGEVVMTFKKRMSEVGITSNATISEITKSNKEV